ncbi:DNA-binding transcriptional LysR family regulator [Saccharomonospora amisosensis]|uniref:DNA-binding transcriptional LysR family regulator n=1 Tax=Saccharomonospora amisosensis TaxID=1128677 RepID=A0A7X5ZQL0_9PSEU|nr:LysR substrate-binding domain-containing protein [Saccharomonospora amisosensis]NIJ11892.1 DNA-binding transcriptional LysR family regulator [Saccharomonospora amisosensis]
MEFQQLVSFVAVAEEHNFGRAAHRLHLAQSSVSLQVKRLEREVGVELLARAQHPVRLTPAGQVFLAEIKEALELVERAADAARSVAEGRSGTLRVGFNFAAGRLVLPSALTRLHAEHPGIRVELTQARSGPQLRALAAGELDVAFVFGSPTGGEVSSAPVQRVDLVAVVNRRHRWARRDHVGFRELSGQQCILFGREQCPAMYDEIHNIAAGTGTQLDVVEKIDDSLATAAAVRARPLVGFASAPRLSQGGVAGLATVPIVDPVPNLVLHAVWRSGEPSGLVRSLLGCLQVPSREPIAR